MIDKKKFLVDFYELASQGGLTVWESIAGTFRLSFPDYNYALVSGGSPAKFMKVCEQFEMEKADLPAEQFNFSHSRGEPREINEDLVWYQFQYEGATYEVVNDMDSGFYRLIIFSTAPVKEVGTKISDIFNEVSSKISVFENQSFQDSAAMERSVEKMNWNDVILPEDQMEDIKTTVFSFFDNKDLYKSLNVAWRRGLLLKGNPGTGKTMLCKNIVKTLNDKDYPALYIKSLTGYDSTENALYEIFDRARKIAPCVIIMEDLDSLINVNNKTVFLNELDGFYSNDGILLIATSNHPEMIDDAMLKRPSRFDRVFSVNLPQHEQRRKYIERFVESTSFFDEFSELFDLELFASEVAQKTDTFTLAYIKEAFVGAALEYANSGKSGIDEDYKDKILSQVQKLKKDIQKADTIDKKVTKAGAGFGASR